MPLSVRSLRETWTPKSAPIPRMMSSCPPQLTRSRNFCNYSIQMMMAVILSATSLLHSYFFLIPGLTMTMQPICPVTNDCIRLKNRINRCRNSPCSCDADVRKRMRHAVMDTQHISQETVTPQAETVSQGAESKGSAETTHPLSRTPAPVLPSHQPLPAPCSTVYGMQFL